MRYYLIAGEASGDLHASNLMAEIFRIDTKALFRFYGGDKMQEVGGTLVKHYKEMSYMGFIPVLTHARTILRNMKACKRDVAKWKPDVLILIDYPGFNLEVAKYIKTHTDIPVYYYISPKIWAWKEYRIKSIRKYVDELFSILPFEVDFFQKKHHYPIHYVGNPCVDAVEEFRQTLGEEKSAVTGKLPIIAVLAGSRVQEVKKNLAKMLLAASKIGGYQSVVAGAPNIPMDIYKKYIPKGMDVEVRFNSTYEILSQADAALVTSGTATLETALLNVPQVVCYYLSAGKFMKWLKGVILKVEFVSLVNLISGKEIVKELIASDMTVDKVYNELKAILPGGEKRQKMLDDYEEMRHIIGPAGASRRAAEIMVKLLTKN
jgi:lipid-A-disaccharide synthase